MNNGFIDLQLVGRREHNKKGYIVNLKYTILRLTIVPTGTKKSMNTALSTKLQILSLLRKSHGWLSGEDISDELGISRAAVAKHITTLRAEGVFD